MCCYDSELYWKPLPAILMFQAQVSSGKVCWVVLLSQLGLTILHPSKLEEDMMCKQVSGLDINSCGTEWSHLCFYISCVLSWWWSSLGIILFNILDFVEFLKLSLQIDNSSAILQKMWWLGSFPHLSSQKSNGKNYTVSVYFWVCSLALISIEMDMKKPVALRKTDLGLERWLTG